VNSSLDSSDSLEDINKHYGHKNLSEKIIMALKLAGKDIKSLTVDDIATFDEFHLGGRPETRKLARLVSLEQGLEVLDIGCGVGGPARTLAAEFGCRISGLDLSDEFCQAAKMLTELVGLSDRVSFYQGNALELPFHKESFQVVWTQHVSMNIKEKGLFYQEICRVLRPGGRLVFHDVFQGPGGELHFPVFWAGKPSLSFLSTPEEARQLLQECGFRELQWQDISETSLEVARKGQAVFNNPGAGSPPLGINVIVADDVPAKVANMVQNLEEKRMVVIQAVFMRVD
jgi:ubiquinone/menaquinone biosynthesis C-methylase UbiE